jgi:MoaA/NifB/PqqE/SkfB family radical SAM enzyme/polysaccharide pyruvyl transferase WcaK-like protein
MLNNVESPLGYIAHKVRRLNAAANFVYKDIRTNKLGQIFPLFPDVLNLLVNDICNSRCQMCNIWTRGLDKQITPEDLSHILSDRLFSRLRYVGVSGGEPTLRKDLPDIFRSVTAKEPRILGTGIITNALKADLVISRVEASAKVCQEAGIPFNVMVSLDGIGEVHDKIRGRKGNFNNALTVIRHFRNHTDVPVSIGCTITKDNVWGVEQVLDFCRQEGVYGRFRVAEFIRRLYNESQTEYIRNFTEQEQYHLGLFFAKLEYTYETSPDVRRTYRSIRRMLLEGLARSIGCPYQSTAVTLDARGQLLYCAPKSPVLGSALENDALTLYRRNISKRKAILWHDCKDCIHDYHAFETITERLEARTDHVWKQRLSLDKAIASAKETPITHSDWKYEPSRVLIVGWYGTETAGDKAILAEIIYQVQARTPDADVMLASLYPFVSQHTLRELGYPNITVVPSYGPQFWDLAATVDEVIMGGGPLMHLEELGLVLWAFIRAKRAGHRCRIWGCGIGPLSRGDRYRDAVREILRLADVIELRDLDSVELGRQLTGRLDIAKTDDPAVGFVLRWKPESKRGIMQPRSYLNLYLRQWTNEYQGDLSDRAFIELREEFEHQLGRGIRDLCNQFSLRPRLLPMHHFCVGNDDRDFNRTFAEKYLADLEPDIELQPISVHEILQSMTEGKLSICMRFHSVLFANTLGVPFVAIDYTNGGKIAAYLRDHNKTANMVSMREIAAGQSWTKNLSLDMA